MIFQSSRAGLLNSAPCFLPCKLRSLFWHLLTAIHAYKKYRHSNQKLTGKPVTIYLTGKLITTKLMDWPVTTLTAIQCPGDKLI